MEEQFGVGDMTLSQVIQVVHVHYGTRAWVNILEALPAEENNTYLEIREWFCSAFDIMRIAPDGTLTIGLYQTNLPDDADTWEVLHADDTTWVGWEPGGSLIVLKDS